MMSASIHTRGFVGSRNAQTKSAIWLVVSPAPVAVMLGQSGGGNRVMRKTSQTSKVERDWFSEQGERS